MRLLTASDRALLVEAAGLEEAMHMRSAWAQLDEVVELVPGARTVLVYFDPLRVDAETLAARLTEAKPSTAVLTPEREQTIAVHYDGEDLDEVAQMLGVSAEELVARHLAADWRVAFSGFAPGFGYAVSEDRFFDVARRTTPRTRVPAGAVGLAGEFTAVYPRETPGGWQLIGHTDARLWDLDREPPALLAPGVRVRFIRAGRSETRVPTALSRTFIPTASVEPSPGGTIRVVRHGLQLLVEDGGRPGHASIGVSASGAADRTAMRDANRAVGNHPHAPVLESVGGALLRFSDLSDGCVAAVTGAEADIRLIDAEGATRDLRRGEPFALATGDELHVGMARRGWRSVIAVRGGIRARAALGSVSSDMLAGVGPRPLADGERIALADPRTAPYPVAPWPVPRELPSAGETVVLRITAGPRDDWFTFESLHALTTQEWEVTPRSDRVGIRLHGVDPLVRAVTGELSSEGVVTGALQVPPDGQPVLFLPDHPLTGGYPVVGALIDRDLDLAAQLPPGVRIRFRLHEEPFHHLEKDTA